MTRRSWIGVHSDVTQKRQCVLASVVRGTVYAQRLMRCMGLAGMAPGPNTSMATPLWGSY